MRGMLLPALILAVGIVQAGHAAEAPPRAGRYTMLPSEGGFVRLDTETGIVTQCLREGDAAPSAWRCLPVSTPDPAASPPPSPFAERLDALEAEVARLAAELGALRKLLAPPQPAPEQISAPPASVGGEAIDRLFSLVRRWKGGPTSETAASP